MDGKLTLMRHSFYQSSISWCRWVLEVDTCLYYIMLSTFIHSERKTAIAKNKMHGQLCSCFGVV